MGEKLDGQFGYSLSLSQDGTILAVGVPFTGDIIPCGFCAIGETGLVKIFRRSGIGSYQQLGQTLNGDNEFDEFGYEVYLSGNGRVLAVGAPGNLCCGCGVTEGYVRIFTYDNGNSMWQERDTLFGEALDDRFGSSVALSFDGNTLAVGAEWNDGSTMDCFDDRGSGYVYRWDGTMYVQIGQDLEGESTLDEYGDNIDLNRDGSIVAVGSRYAFNNVGDQTGHVRVFEYSEDRNLWVQRGPDIDGLLDADYFGENFSLSGDGSRLVVGASESDAGAPCDPGQVRILEWDGKNYRDTFFPLTEVECGADFGEDVDISEDGTVILVGAKDLFEPSVGALLVYEEQD
jgi:hypothetical protein